MGRSPTFSFSRDVVFPKPSPSSTKISQLVVGQQIKLTTKRFKPFIVCRSASTYRLATSSVHSVLVVDSIDYDAEFHSNGIRCIVLRNPSVPLDGHIYTWVLTTDGYIRESEHFGIDLVVTDIRSASESVDLMPDTVPETAEPFGPFEPFEPFGQFLQPEQFGQFL